MAEDPGRGLFPWETKEGMIQIAEDQLALENDPEAKLVLEKHMEWLNLWAKENDGEDGYQIQWGDHFKYGDTKILSKVDLPQGKHLILQAGTGDDGGPAEIFAWFERTWYRLNEEEVFELKFIMQMFDTMPSWVYGEGWTAEKGQQRGLGSGHIDVKWPDKEF